jgi:hypothetical protein
VPPSGAALAAPEFLATMSHPMGIPKLCADARGIRRVKTGIKSLLGGE